MSLETGLVGDVLSSAQPRFGAHEGKYMAKEVRMLLVQSAVREEFDEIAKEVAKETSDKELKEALKEGVRVGGDALPALNLELRELMRKAVIRTALNGGKTVSPRNI